MPRHIDSNHPLYDPSIIILPFFHANTADLPGSGLKPLAYV